MERGAGQWKRSRGQKPGRGWPGGPRLGTPLDWRPPGTGKLACTAALALNRYKVASELPVCSVQFSHLVVSDSATPWTAARQYVAKMQIIQNLGNISLPRMVLGFSLSNAGSHHSFNLPPDSKKWPLRTDLLWPHAKAGQVQRPWHQGTQIATKIYI